MTILRALVDACERVPSVRHTAELADTTGLDQAEVILSLRALEDDGYVAISSTINVQYAPGFDFVTIRPLPPARRVTGQWPAGDAYDAILAGVDARLAATQDATTRWIAGLRVVERQGGKVGAAQWVG